MSQEMVYCGIAEWTLSVIFLIMFLQLSWNWIGQYEQQKNEREQKEFSKETYSREVISNLEKRDSHGYLDSEVALCVL